MSRPCANTALYTADTDLARAVGVFLEGRGKLRVVDSARKLRTTTAKERRCLVIVDLRCDAATALLEELMAANQEAPVIAMGVPGSEPFLEAHRLGVYAAEALPLERWSFKQRLNGAFSILRLIVANAALHEDVREAGHVARAAALAENPPQPASTTLSHWGRTLRHMGDVDAVIDGLVEGVAKTMLVSRVGLFARSGEDEEFVFRAGVRCLASTPSQTYPAHDSLAEWLEEQACQVARYQLDHIADGGVRSALRDELDQLGAEIIVPLQGRGRLIGWLFVGQRGTGQPFTIRDQEELLLIADTVSATLENALLYGEMTRQKTMAETLLQGMPSGIVAVDAEGRVQSFNQAAATIFDRHPDRVLGHHVSELGSHVADLLLRALDSDLPDLPVEWTHPVSDKYLLAEGRRLTAGEACLGAVAILQDLTQKHQLEARQEGLERTTFWNALAKSLSHHFTQPLVPIKTFAQLLPEKYDDPEFRTMFEEVVSKEVDRLDLMIKKFSKFADPDELNFDSLDVPQLLQNSMDTALKQVNRNGVDIEVAFEDALPPVWGDDRSLGECFAAIIKNALEGVSKAKQPKVKLSAHHAAAADGPDQVTVMVEDNGPGIPEEEKARVFAPFSGSKPDGMGLGLPIARRTILDHGGHIDLESDDHGTRVHVDLPTAKNGRHA